MISLEAHDRVLVVGKTGKGKSTWVKNLVRAELARGSRVLAFDPLDEHSREGLDMQGVDLGALRERCTVDELIADPRLLDAPKLSLAVVPDDVPEKAAEDFGRVSELVKLTGKMHRGRLPLVWVVEEVGAFGEYCRAPLNEVATQFRHYGVAVVLCAQRLTQISKTARVQASQIVSFAQDDDDDIQALSSRFGGTLAESARQLDRGEFLHWREGRTPTRSNTRKAA